MKSDAAKELVEAVQYLGWLPEEQVPNDQHRNAKLESNIRRIKEGTRAVHLAAGFPHEFWPRRIEYFCVAKNFTTLAPIHPHETEEAQNLKQGWTCYDQQWRTLRRFESAVGCISVLQAVTTCLQTTF